MSNKPIPTKARYNVLETEQRAEVRRLLKDGVRKEELAVKFNVHFNTIGNIAKECEKEERPLDRAAHDRTTSTTEASLPHKGAA